MKIKYEFANETVEVEVSEEWGNIVVDLDREEYNTNHKETRRHCSLEAYNLDDALIPSDENIEADFLNNEFSNTLLSAIEQLEPRQKELIYRVFYNGEKMVDIAAEQGVTKSAISHALDRALKKIKNYLN